MQKYEEDLARDVIIGILRSGLEGVSDIQVEGITDEIIDEVNDIEDEEEVLKITKTDMAYSGYGDDTFAIIKLVADKLGLTLGRLIEYAEKAKEDNDE